MKIMLLFLTILISFGVQAADTLYVKKVYVNRWKTRVKSGYIIRLTDSTYRVNGKVLKLIAYKPTNRKNFKSNNHAN